jgi:ribosomal protein S18 acetylase RimI-like enzyme
MAIIPSSTDHSYRMISPKRVYRSFQILQKEAMTFQIIGFANRHLPAIAELLNDEYRHSFEFIPFDEERILSQIRRRHLKILVAEENDRAIGLIATHSHENSEEDITWLAASKQRDQKSFEDMLLKELEGTVKADTISTMIDEGSPKIIDWINRGYVLRPGFQRMSAKLDESQPVPNVKEDIKLRSLRMNEEEQLIEAVNKGFGWKRLERGDLEIWKSEDPPFSEEWVQVAEAHERIVSVVVAKPDTDARKYLRLNRGYLGPAATLSEFRNMHLASALTARAMNFLFRHGMNSARLGTSEENVSSIALLQSLGFKVENVRKILRKQMKGV